MHLYINNPTSNTRKCIRETSLSRQLTQVPPIKQQFTYVNELAHARAALNRDQITAQKLRLGCVCVCDSSRTNLRQKGF
jgi:hypothetical protein